MATPLKPSEEYMYNWTNRTVLDFAKAIAPEPVETRAVVNVTPAATVVLNTTANKTIFNLGAVNGNTFYNILITLGNPGQQVIGDTLILMLNAIGNDVEVEFSTTHFYNQITGNQNSALPLLNAGERSVTIFTFDGLKFTCTNDNG